MSQNKTKLTQVEAPTNLKVSISSPTVGKPNELTQEDVWGKFENHTKVSDGMIVARSDDKCPYFGDVVPYKSVTVVCDMKDFNQVTYWLEYVHGGDCVTYTKELPKGKIAIRSDYQCW